MLAYRHGFHVGNHGDVLKHWILIEALAALNRKDKPWTYYDTHAGAGRYALHRRLGGRFPTEWREGIARLWEQRAQAPAALRRYLATLAAFNERDRLVRYPGSPALARHLARPEVGDRLWLCERHPSDFAVLFRRYEKDPLVRCVAGDGFTLAPRAMPPAVRRGLVMIDPSYELARDYVATVQTVRAVRTRFPQAVVMVWYPLLKRFEVPQMVRRLRNVLPEDHLWVELQVKAPPQEGWGMYGSGVVVIQPPFGLSETIAAGVPWLKTVLAQDESARVAWEAKEA